MSSDPLTVAPSHPGPEGGAHASGNFQEALATSALVTDDDVSTVYYDCPGIDDVMSLCSDDLYYDARSIASHCRPTLPDASVRVPLPGEIPRAGAQVASSIRSLPLQEPLAASDDPPPPREGTRSPCMLHTPDATPTASPAASLHFTDALRDEAQAASSKGSMLERAYSALHELLITEERYVASLTHFAESYVQTIPHHSSHCGQALAQHLQQHLGPLVEFQRSFLSALRRVLDDQTLETETQLIRLAELFISHEQGFMVYLPFCANTMCFGKDVKHLEKAVEWARFNALDGPTRANSAVSKLTSCCTRLGLLDYLMKPIQRLCLYPLLLKDMAKPFSAPSKTRHKLQRAQAIVQNLTRDINEAKRQHELAYQTSLFIERLDATAALPTSLFHELGGIVLAGALETVLYDTHPPRVRYYGCVLFTGFMILVKVKNATTYEPKHWFPLTAVMLLDLGTSVWPSPDVAKTLDSPTRVTAPSLTHAWRVVHTATHQHLDLAAACQEEKSVWWDCLQIQWYHANSRSPGAEPNPWPCSFASRVRAKRHSPRLFTPVEAGGEAEGTGSSTLLVERMNQGDRLPSTTVHGTSRPRPLSLITDFADLTHGSKSLLTPSSHRPSPARKAIVDSRFGAIFSHDCLRGRARALAAAGLNTTIHALPARLPDTPTSTASSSPLTPTSPGIMEPTGALDAAGCQPAHTRSGVTGQVRSRRAISDGAMARRKRADGHRSSRAWMLPTPLPRRHSRTTSRRPSAPAASHRARSQMVSGVDELDLGEEEPQGPVAYSAGPSPTLRSNKLIHMLGRLSLSRGSSWASQSDLAGDEDVPYLTRSDSFKNIFSAHSTRRPGFLNRRSPLERSRSVVDVSERQSPGAAYQHDDPSGLSPCIDAVMTSATSSTTTLYSNPTSSPTVYPVSVTRRSTDSGNTACMSTTSPLLPSKAVAATAASPRLTGMSRAATDRPASPLAPHSPLAGAPPLRNQSSFVRKLHAWKSMLGGNDANALPARSASDRRRSPISSRRGSGYSRPYPVGMDTYSTLPALTHHREAFNLKSMDFGPVFDIATVVPRSNASPPSLTHLKEPTATMTHVDQ
ncbi:hypothetical protein H4R35_000029 [Dimargaris xerosporica]|nr:hypothetical protein H4R35_000029 [Dimargaris xerosporica]